MPILKPKPINDDIQKEIDRALETHTFIMEAFAGQTE
jgi:hypothetical protein